MYRQAPGDAVMRRNERIPTDRPTDRQTTLQAPVSMTDGAGLGRQQQQPRWNGRPFVQYGHSPGRAKFVMRPHCANISVFPMLPCPLRSSSSGWRCVCSISSNCRAARRRVVYERRISSSSILITNVAISQAISTNAIKLTSAPRRSGLDRRFCLDLL